jgi:divalent metal cation (Fe/Co/Zn/Cd) transporter
MKFLTWSRVDLLVQAIFLIAAVVLWLANSFSFLTYQPFWVPVTGIYLIFILGIWQVYSNLIYLYFADDWNTRFLLLAKFSLHLTPFPFSIPFWLFSLEDLSTTLIGVIVGFGAIAWHLVFSYKQSQTKIQLHVYNPITGQVYLAE